MANFNWKDNHSSTQWLQRFPSNIHAKEQWQEFSRAPRDIQNLFEIFADARQDWERRLATQLTKPRVFISHRQADEKRALAIRDIVERENCEYWLDVTDPTLRSANGSSLPVSQKSVVIAAIIEMALLNCSHVLAVVTKNSYGSTWVPYEYGRVKVGKVWSQQACCWIDSDPSSQDFKNKATYLRLGEITTSDSDIRRWLKEEKIKWPPNVPKRPTVGRIP